MQNRHIVCIHIDGSIDWYSNHLEFVSQQCSNRYKISLIFPTEKYDWNQSGVVSVKGVVFPFKKFPHADSILGPEMKSTGESMGRGRDFSEALLKAFYSSNLSMPESGEVFFSLRDKDKDALLPIAKGLSEMGFSISGTFGTAQFLEENGIKCLGLKKVHEGRPQHLRP